MFAVDGTKMLQTCAVSPHNNLVVCRTEEIMEDSVTQIDDEQIVSGSGNSCIYKFRHCHNAVFRLYIIFYRLDEQDDIVGFLAFVTIG